MTPELVLEILEELQRQGGAIKDSILYQILKKRYNLSPREFNRILMILELRRLIYVETIKKGEKLIQLYSKL
ncbi:MAG: hypothetical protein J7L38_08315 [Thermoproteales archaeon]|nr:hypothetical protein [Thermoproteales archaeon]RLE66600.1 MAG: hypothetical protein DRJ47_01930 [Thermoprotei archaeon]